MIEREPSCYDRPPLSKAALQDGSPLSSLAFADDATATQLGIQRVLNRTVVRVDPAEAVVELDDASTIAATDIVLATGADARRPEVPGADLPGVLTLRTYADALALRAYAGRAVAIVGAGLIGAEVASVMRQLGSAVTLIDHNPVPGVRLFGPTLAQHLHAMHTAHGVDVSVDQVAAFEHTDDGIRLILRSGSTIVAEAALVGAGVTFDTTLARAAGAETASGIVVDSSQRTSVPHLYAVGDATQQRLADGGLAPCRGHWEAAQLDGRTAAASILGQPAPVRGAEWFWSDRYGHHVEVVGDVFSRGIEVVRPGADHPSIFRLDGGCLVGAASVDDPLTVRAARRIIDRRILVSADQLSDPSVPVRSLIPKGH